MKKQVNKNILIYSGLITGAIAGFMYWKFVGCATGSCMITSNPYISTGYGAIMGGLGFSLLKKNKSENN